MKKFLPLLLIILTVFAFGCITDSGNDSNDDNGGNGSSASAETYLPFKTGATWSYLETMTSYWEETPDISTSTYTMTCTGTSTQNEETYWTLENEYEDYSSEFNIRIDGDDVYILNPNYASKAITAGKAANLPVSVRKKASDYENPVFKFKKSPGYTWTIEEDSDSGDGYSYSYKSTGKFHGIEDVTTAAGTFKDCAKFDETIVSTYSSDGQTWSHNSTISRWFAPGVGSVKESETFSTDGELSEIFESELTSYDLDGTIGGGDGDGDEDLYTISGTLLDSYGYGLEGILVNATAEISEEDVFGYDYTDVYGNYIIENCAPGTWTIEPDNYSYDYNPESKEVVVTNSNMSDVDFDEDTTGGGSTTGDYSISGAILNTGTTDGVADVTVELYDSMNGFFLTSMMTDTDGAYTFSGLANNSYSVYVEKAGYYLDPMTRLVNIDDESISGKNFEGWGEDNLYIISGTVLNTDDTGMPGVAVTLEDDEGNETIVKTDSYGDYEIRDVSGTYEYDLTVYTVTKTITVNSDLTINF
ncbi:carboxypeptidase-like regulatory domain-containing protein [Candidatus Latescibacterota bacterium]